MKKLKSCLSRILFITLCAQTSHASSLDYLALADGDTYFSILHESLENGDAQAWFADSDAYRAVDEGNWRHRVTLDSLRLRDERPGQVMGLYELQGLRAEVYLKRRWPQPECFRELRGSPELAPLMMEIFLHGLDSYPYSGTGYRDAESRALRYGILAAVGESNHPAAEWFLEEVAQSYYESQGTKFAAFDALGRIKGVSAYEKLVMLYASSKEDVKAQAVLLRAIGRHQTPAAWRFVEPILRQADPLLVGAAISASQSIVAKYGWQGALDEALPVRLEVGDALLSLLPRANEVLADRVVEAISAMGDSGVAKRVEELLARQDLKELERRRFQRVQARLALALSR